MRFHYNCLDFSGTLLKYHSEFAATRLLAFYTLSRTVPSKNNKESTGIDKLLLIKLNVICNTIGRPAISTSVKNQHCLQIEMHDKLFTVRCIGKKTKQKIKKSKLQSIKIQMYKDKFLRIKTRVL